MCHGLAQRVTWEFRRELQMLGDLERSQPFAGPVSELLRLGGSPGTPDNDCGHLFSLDPVWNAEHDHLGDSGMFQEAILDLPRVDVLPVTNYEIAAATF